MAGESLLPDEVQRRIREIGRVDVVVGIPSYNSARTISHVVRAVHAGFAKYFPHQQALLVNSDGGSGDGTPDLVRQPAISDYRTLLTAHPLHALHKIVTPYHGIPGKGSALRTVFKIAAELGAKACAVVDADLRSITPEWVDLLVSPVLKEGFDFVAPLYHRHKYDGTITNSIVYPLTRALYGQRVRQPIGGDFGLSGRLAEHYVSQDVWHTDVARFGIDIWMTTTAITGGFRICQSFLGAKIHDVKDPAVDLSAMLTQVVSSVFGLMETYEAHWTKVRGSTSVPVFGFEYTVGLEPIRVNVERMIHSFHAGLRDLVPLWEGILARETLEGIRRVGSLSGETFRFPPDLWVRTVYDFAIAYHKRVINREHLLRSLTPLYLARTGSFVLETPEATAGEVDEILEKLCQEYESFKPDLIERWQS
ncbi:MAG: glycosyl transferase family 2 [Acidobacteria bacterium]|nr:glycosyl transferase family 2 [Acidobacteriota bacterium]